MQAPPLMACRDILGSCHSCYPFNKLASMHKSTSSSVAVIEVTRDEIFFSLLTVHPHSKRMEKLGPHMLVPSLALLLASKHPNDLGHVRGALVD